MTTSQIVSILRPGSDLAELNDWLSSEHGVLALRLVTSTGTVWTDAHEVQFIAFGASDGSAFVVDGSDVAFVRKVLSTAIRDDRRWWGFDATQIVNSLCAVFAVRIRGLRCALTLVKVLEPDAVSNSQPTLASLLHSGQTVDTCIDDAGQAAAAAVGCARLVQTHSLRASRASRRLVLRATRDDDLWRGVAMRGYQVDMDALSTKLAGIEAAVAHSKWRWGVDLTKSGPQTRDWLEARDILITDAHGKVTMKNDFYANATVPEDVLADWNDFKTIRRAGDLLAKMRELRDHADSTGRIFPKIRSMGASSGRMSISEPALQNIQPPLRTLLLADDGSVLVACDLDRIEPRVVAGLSDDPALSQAVRGDIYTELAVAVWGELARTDPARRAVSKVAFLASLYGQGATSLSGTLGKR